MHNLKSFSWKFNNFVANFIYVSYYSKKQVIKTETRKTEISEKKKKLKKKERRKWGEFVTPAFLPGKDTLCPDM